MYKLAFVLMLFLPGAHSVSVDLTNLWSSFKSLHSKSYSADEDHIRFAAFENNTRRIVHHNLEADFGLHTYMVAVNSFATHTQEELDRRPCIKMDEHLAQPDSTTDTLLDSSLPESIDYRTKGLVSAVQSQADCFACFIFGAIGALESTWASSKHTKLVPLSVQSVLDCYARNCSKPDTPSNVYRYIIRNGGIDTDDSYPYSGVVSDCMTNKNNFGASMKSFRIFNNLYGRTMEAVARQGPVAACLNITPDFESYKKGIYKNSNCTDYMNHAVTIVGYGEENGEKYWILKNCWGTYWGEEGYMRFSRGSDMCGIMLFVVIPIV